MYRVEPISISITDQMWKWTEEDLVNEVIQMAAFSDDVNNHDAKYIEKMMDSKARTESPGLILIPEGLV